MKMKNKNLMLVVGQMSLAVSILLNHFVEETSIISFMIGLFTGLAIVLNTAYIIIQSKQLNKGE